MTLEIQTPDQIRGLSRDELHRIQSRKLRSMLEVVGEKNEFYRRKFGAAGVDPAEVQDLEDLRRLPFTTKSELAFDQEAHPPYGTILTYPVTDYTRLHQTSGTRGRPLRWLDTPESWDCR